jgi:geranylgeranyl pyrophosphate synthase
LKGILERDTDEADLLERAVRIAYASGSIAYAQEYARTLVEKGKTRLRRSFPDRSDSRELLLSMADFFIERIS